MSDLTEKTTQELVDELSRRGDMPRCRCGRWRTYIGTWDSDGKTLRCPQGHRQVLVRLMSAQRQDNPDHCGALGAFLPCGDSLVAPSQDDATDELRAELAATRIKLAAARLALAACREVREAREA